MDDNRESIELQAENAKDPNHNDFSHQDMADMRRMGKAQEFRVR